MGKNNNQKYSTGISVFIVFLLLIVIIVVILATYASAKYTSSIEMEATAQVAKWNVKATGSKTFEKEYEHIVKNRIAPGTNGSFDINIDIQDTEVDVEYKVILENVVPLNSDTDIVPTNLVLKGSIENKEIVFQNKALVNNGIIAESTIKKGQTAPVTSVLSFDWPYETGSNDAEKAENNIKDTEDSKKAGSLKIKYKVVASQVKPNEK